MSYLQDLRDEPYRFDFFAVLRRMERSFPRKPRIGDSNTRHDEFVLLGEDPYLEFPASNLYKVDVDGRERLRIFSRFLGLLGPQGALPLTTTEEAYGWVRAHPDGDGFPRFLDILNHRFLQLFFRAWADARAVAQHDRPDEDRFKAYIGSAIGIGSAPYRDLDFVPDEAKLAYAGLIAAEAKSGSRLAAFISGNLDVKAEVEEFVASRLVVEADERSLLGRRYCVLGVDSLVGGSVFSLEDKIRIRLYTRNLADYERFLPQERSADQLVDLVFLYLGEQLDWDVELAIPFHETRPVELGRWGRLGWTTWMSPAMGAKDGGLRMNARFHPAERRRHKHRQAVQPSAGGSQ